MVAQIAGIAVSPVLFTWAGYGGAFGLRVATSFCALVYVIVAVNEPIKTGAEKVR